MPTEITVLSLMENLENNQWMYSYEERWKQLKELLEIQRKASQKESKEQFSPSPWKEEVTEDGDLFVVMDDSHKVFIGNLEDTCSTCHANARLIKAAPAMFRALTKSIEMMKIDLDAFGDCDHSVGICNCDLKHALEDAERVVAEVRSEKLKGDFNNLYWAEDDQRSLNDL